MQHTPPHHNARFYIIITTLIIGGIFIMLLVNNDGSKYSLTNAIVSAFENESLGEPDSDILTGAVVGVRETKPNVRDVDVQLKFNQIPSFREDSITLDVLEIVVKEFTGSLIIDSSEVKTSSEQVTLRLEGLKGIIESGDTILFEGTADKVIINNIALSSEKKIQVLLSTDFNNAKLTGLKLTKSFALRGDGELNAGGNTLKQSIKDGLVSITAFMGEININKGNSNSSSLDLSGIADSISVNSDMLSLNLG